MQIVSFGDNLHEMPDHIFWENKKKRYKMLFAKNFTQHAKP